MQHMQFIAFMLYAIHCIPKIEWRCCTWPEVEWSYCYL